tara:strand:- start:17769 stop:17897 length:129 start_codon:yes stop_codon:yes gene_type:complete
MNIQKRWQLKVAREAMEFRKNNPKLPPDFKKIKGIADPKIFG